MKKIFIYFFLLLVSLYGRANPADTLMKTANDYYQKGDFAKAGEIYKDLADSGWQSVELFFNLGNTYYKQRKYDLAILFYERARILSPNDEDINYNLDMANRYVLDKIEILPQFFIRRWISDITGVLTADTWALVALVLFVFLLAALLFYLFSNTAAMRKTGFSVSLVLVFLWLFAFYFARVKYHEGISRNYAIITSPSVTARSTPDDSGTELFVVHEGLKVFITDSIGEWTEVRLPDGNKGWMRYTDLAKI